MPAYKSENPNPTTLIAKMTKEAPLHISNVMLVVDGQATRVGFQMDGDKKVRVAKKTGKVID